MVVKHGLLTSRMNTMAYCFEVASLPERSACLTTDYEVHLIPCTGHLTFNSLKYNLLEESYRKKLKYN